VACANSFSIATLGNLGPILPRAYTSLGGSPALMAPSPHVGQGTGRFSIVGGVPLSSADTIDAGSVETVTCSRAVPAASVSRVITFLLLGLRIAPGSSPTGEHEPSVE